MVAFQGKGEGNGGLSLKARGKAMVAFLGKGEGHGGLPRQGEDHDGIPRQRGRPW